MNTRTMSRTAMIVTTKWMRFMDSANTIFCGVLQISDGRAKTANGAAAASHKRPYGRKCSCPDHGTGIGYDGTSRINDTTPPPAKTAAPIPNSFAGDLGQPMFFGLSSRTGSGVVFAL